eukprot:5152844-Amphidinium_carterae.1
MHHGTRNKEVALLEPHADALRVIALHIAAESIGVGNTLIAGSDDAVESCITASACVHEGLAPMVQAFGDQPHTLLSCQFCCLRELKVQSLDIFLRLSLSPSPSFALIARVAASSLGLGT